MFSFIDFARAGLLLCAALLLSCSSVTEQPQSVQAAADSPEVAAMLAEADRALRQDRLSPDSNISAYSLYQQILQQVPQHPRALQGIEAVQQRYLQLIEIAYNADREGRARELSDRALKTGVSHEALWVLQERYIQRQKQRVMLPQSQLSARSPILQQQLEALARQVRQQDGRILIIARSDGDARWVYRTMKQAVSGYRIRGNIELGSPPRVIVLNLEEPTGEQ